MQRQVPENVIAISRNGFNRRMKLLLYILWVWRKYDKEHRKQMDSNDLKENKRIQ